MSLNSLGEIFSASITPSSQNTRTRSPIRRTLVNCLNSTSPPLKSTCTIGRTASDRFSRPTILDGSASATRLYLPVVLLHQSCTADSAEPKPQILRFFDILTPLPSSSPSTKEGILGRIERVYESAALRRCSAAMSYALFVFADAAGLRFSFVA